MSTHPTDPTLQQAFGLWKDAFLRRDLPSLMATYAADAVMYDVKPPFQIRGLENIRAVWEEAFSCFPPGITYSVFDEKIESSGDLAVMHRVQRFDGAPAGHPMENLHIRLTVTLRREHGRWLVTHEHVSLPFNPETGLVVGTP
ncbi:MAG: hypothetical protein BGO12_18655 [Verrucomicrobia bacterium 61-8]|nr:nuclear transport factor 2 family protein [Verrucomicrobiota bacterium]OJV17401.1 MAG: hypothetical protein BGO12_18655 [Verrucomicrobia bacterium 61-8]